MTMRDFYRKILLGGTSFAALMLGVGVGETVFAQAPTQAVANEAPQALRNYLRSNVIRLPIEFNTQLRSAIQEIHLYCKESPTAAWTLRDKVEPTADAFNIRLQKDGEYAFTMVTVDKQGRVFPDNIQAEPPGSIVIVDTQRPVIELTNLGPSPDGLLIQCDVRDPHLDLGKMHFSFQGGDKVFRQLVPIAGKSNVYRIPSEAVFSGLVRVYAQDLAGNQTVCEEHLNHMNKGRGEAVMNPPALPMPQVGLTMPAPVIENKLPNLQPPPRVPTDVVKGPSITPEELPISQPAMPPRLPTEIGRVPSITPEQPAISPLTMAPIQQPSVNPIVARPNDAQAPRLNEAPRLNDEPRLNEAPIQQTNYRAPQNRQLVSTTKVFLDYQIENAQAAGTVEAWLTRDHGKSWQKHAEDTQRKSPVEVNLPGDGIFGLTLVVSSPSGKLTPPAAGDAPDGWIEVDTTKPLAHITKIESAHEGGQHNVHIHWNVKDANLTDTPVELLFAATPQGPWVSIAKGLKADGQYTWTPPAAIGAQIHVRLLARDAVGNESIVNSLEPVTLAEPARPRVILRGISTGASAPQIAPISTK